MPLPKKKLIPGFLFMLVIAAFADPAWWAARGVKSTDPAANLAPATIGQAKHLAAMALAELEGKLPPAAFQSLQTDLAAIVDLTLPDPLPTDFYEKQRAVLLNGQLKAIAKPFYDHLRAQDPAWLDNAMLTGQLVVMEPGTSIPSPYPWTEAATDDANMAVATLGQLKAMFSLSLEIFALDTDGDGIPDYWEDANGFDSENPGDAFDDPDGDGLSNLVENQLGTDANSFDQIGMLNPGFDTAIQNAPVLTFGPSKVYHEDVVEGWNAPIGEHIEIWKQSDGNPYVELQADLGGKGIEQEFDVLPAAKETFILRYKGRYNGGSEANAFTLKVEGAEELLIDGQPAQTQGDVKQKSFMTDDEDGKYSDWQYASVTITADSEATTLVPVTLTLIPDDTDQAITYGGFVDLLPVDFTVVFGIGAPVPPPEQNSRELLELYLETIKIERKGNIWVVAGNDEQDAERRYIVEIADSEEKLLHALGSEGRTVVFDGHANFGLGPNFAESTFKTVEEFTNFGVNQTDIPIEFRGDGNEPDPMPFYRPEWLEINTGDEELDWKLSVGRSNLSSEGWAYLVLQPDQVSGDVTNCTVPHVGGLRYVNDQGKGDGQILSKQGEGFNNEWHFTQTIDGLTGEHLVVSAPGAQVPRLRYKTFFYNACATGPHFIENFEHEAFVYTKAACQVQEATQIFIQGLLEAKTLDEIMPLLNKDIVHGRGERIIYAYEDDF